MENQNKGKFVPSVGNRKKIRPSKEALDQIANSVNEQNQIRAYGDKMDGGKEEQKEENSATPIPTALPIESVTQPETSPKPVSAPQSVPEAAIGETQSHLSPRESNAPFETESANDQTPAPNQEAEPPIENPVLVTKPDSISKEPTNQTKEKKTPGTKKNPPREQEEDQEATTLSVLKTTARKVKYASALMGIEQRKFVTDAIDLYIQHCKKTGKLVPMEL